MTDAIAIKDLKPGDAFAGRVDVPEITIEGDVASMAWVEKKGQFGNLKEIDSDIATLDRDIAYRQSKRAGLVAMREALVASKVPVAIPKEK